MPAVRTKLEGGRLSTGPRCRVYLHDAARAAGASYLNSLESDHNREDARHGRPASWSSMAWQEDKYAQELWLQHALANHPWRVDDAHSADVVLLAANFSLLCAAHRRLSHTHSASEPKRAHTLTHAALRCAVAATARVTCGMSISTTASFATAARSGVRCSRPAVIQAAARRRRRRRCS